VKLPFGQNALMADLTVSFSFFAAFEATDDSESELDHLLLVLGAVSNLSDTGAVFMGFFPSLL
jgi:hypothetical protein